MLVEKMSGKDEERSSSVLDLFCETLKYVLGVLHMKKVKFWINALLLSSSQGVAIKANSSRLF